MFGRKIGRLIRHSESGISLVETLIAMAVIGVIVIACLSGLGTSAKAGAISDEQTTAGSLARSQMEWVKKAAYVPGAATYAAAAIPAEDDYTGYTVAIVAAALNNPDDGIQKITVNVSLNSQNVFTLEGYKVNR